MASRTWRLTGVDIQGNKFVENLVVNKSTRMGLLASMAEWLEARELGGSTLIPINNAVDILMDSISVSIFDDIREVFRADEVVVDSTRNVGSPHT